jgi:Ca2+-transporting ATPase
MKTDWWQLKAQDAIKEMATDLVTGLSDQEAKARLDKYGLNQLKEKKSHSLWFIFLEQFKDFIIWVLIVAALISGFLQEWVDALAIIAIVILNAIMGFVQEYRAEKALTTLKKLASPSSKVIRQGDHKVIPSSELVPGDIIELEAGDHVPADSRLVSVTAHFTTQEASLTGESNPVIKTAYSLDEKDIPLADRANIVYMGTSVTSGKAKALVVETGMQTELGRIADMIQEIKQEVTPLQRKLEQFGKRIVLLSFVLVALVFLLSVLRGGKILDVFLMAVSLAVAAIPEGLPAVVTIALTLGVQKMVKRHALIRKLPSVETLGSTTVICSDKTGILTKNEMTIQAIFADGNVFKVTGIGYEPKGEFLHDEKPINPNEYPGLNKTLLCGALCNSSQLVKNDDTYRIIGDPTEGAILACAAKMGLWKDALEEKFPFVDEIPFDSERKMMSIIRKDKGKLVIFTKGAPDILLDNCTSIEEKGIIRELTDKDREVILQANNDLADQALRVLAVAYSPLNGDSNISDSDLIEKDLTFVGLVAMIDPPREEVREAIKMCKTAGIKTVMITGDHKNTAAAIARDLGFFEQNSLAITGAELDKLDDDEFTREIEIIPVYARVSPENKLRIVRSWRKKGEIVAMTGDGINDAPAVKEADIGIAMGRTGTDVTKEVSDMVITDDNFASIVAAIEEGRGIYENIKKFIHYLLSCNVGEILVMFVASLTGMPVPLLAVQILWINLVTDGLPALALGIDPIDPNIMQRPRRDPSEPVVTKQGGLVILVQGTFIALCTLFAFGFVLVTKGTGLFAKGESIGLGQARTAAFVVLVCSELFRSFSFRSMTESVFKVGFFANMKLIYAVLLSFLLQMSIVYIPFLQTIFKTEPLGVTTWVLMVVLSSLPFWSMEFMKAITKNWKSG